MQMGFYFDQTKCVGCYACDLICKIHHFLSPDVHWRRIRWINGREPVAFLSVSCLHCAAPPCVEACPASAISKRDDTGIVLVDSNMCLGKDECGALCAEVCPYDAPQFGPDPNAKMSKCDFCFGRLQVGKLPYCVTMCNQEALDYGPLHELMTKYENARDARGFSCDENINPSIIFKPGESLSAIFKPRESSTFGRQR